VVTGSYDTSSLTNLEQIMQPLANYDYVVSFDYLRSLTDSNNLLPKTLAAQNWIEIKQYDYHAPLGMVRVYTRLPEVN
jgi:hypothetical protein